MHISHRRHTPKTIGANLTLVGQKEPFIFPTSPFVELICRSLPDSLMPFCACVSMYLTLPRHATEFRADGIQLFKNKGGSYG